MTEVQAVTRTELEQTVEMLALSAEMRGINLIAYLQDLIEVAEEYNAARTDNGDRGISVDSGDETDSPQDEAVAVEAQDVDGESEQV